jgi:hypothetical protein
MRQPKMYLVRFKSNRDGFIGWNSVYAISLPDAKKKLLVKCGQKFFDQIDWSTLKTGKEAESIDAGLEKQHNGMFD